MPIYEYACPECHRVDERFVPHRKSANMRIVCPTSGCNGVQQRIMSLPVIRPDSMPPYYDHGLGEKITSRSHRRDVMRAKGLVEADKGNTTPHGTRGTVFSFPGQPAMSVAPSGFFAPREKHLAETESR